MLGYCTCLGFHSPKKAMIISVISPAVYFLFHCIKEPFMEGGGTEIASPKSYAGCIHKPTELFFSVNIEKSNAIYMSSLA